MKIAETPGKISRRHFLNSSALAGAVLTTPVFIPGAIAAQTAGAQEPDAVSKPTKIYADASATDPQKNAQAVKPVRPGEMPCGQLGRLKLSRIIAGGNIISGWCHARDLLFIRRLAEAYLTEQKQFDTLQLLEETGVNSIMIDLDQMPIIKNYRQQRGGGIRTVVSVRESWGEWRQPNFEDLKRQIAHAIDQGADTLFLHGAYCDRLVQANKPGNIEALGRAIAYIREMGLTAGLGSHALEVPMACDKQGIEPDYYVKTFHHDRYWSATPKDRRKRFCVDGPRSLDHNEFHDNIFCIDPEETAAYMRDKKQPWIAFKVLAAGAIPAQSGFEYGFANGADFLAVGMFDFNVVEDVKIAREVLKQVKRERPWRA